MVVVRRIGRDKPDGKEDRFADKWWNRSLVPGPKQATHGSFPVSSCDAGVLPASVGVVGSQKPPFGSVTETTATDPSFNALSYVRRASGLVLTPLAGM